MRTNRGARDRLGIDAATAERLIVSEIDPEDAPPAYAEVVRVLTRAAGPALPEELHGEAAAVAMFLIASSGGEPVVALRRRVSEVLSAKVGAAVLAGAILLGGGMSAAAAATGHLPDAMQNLAHSSLADLGVSVPAARPTVPAVQPGGDDTTTTQPVPVGLGDPATPGQGPDHGQAVCTQASAGKCQAGQHGEGSPGDTTTSTERGKPDSPGNSGGHTPNSATPPVTHSQGPPTSVPKGPPASVPSPGSKGKSGN